ncbi:MAG: hypothetical protein FJ221_00225 [Lentisphaerae bacterium]|nr:hypothetical protein [Lentisphaerota bacterium]
MNAWIRGWTWAASALVLAAGAGAQAPEAGWQVDVDTVRVANAALDLREAGLFRLADGSLVVRVRCGAVPAPESVRILLDVDEPTNGLAGTGADLMIEGDVLFRYPRFAKGWEWNEVSGVASVASEFGTRSMLLPAGVPAPRMRWAVETLDREWKTVDRLPAQGMVESRLEQLPEMGPSAGPPPASGLLITAAPPLVARFPALAQGAWAEDAAAKAMTFPLHGGAAAPVRFEVRPVGGAAEAMTPASAWRDGERVKWSGTNAGLSWTMLAVPGAAGDLWVAAEFQGGREAAFDFAASIGLPAWSWTVADGTRAGRPLDAQAWRGGGLGTTSPVGEARSQALWPFAVASSPSGTVALVADPDEPRPVFYEGGAQPPTVAIVHPMAVTPMTTRSPGRACVAFLVRGAAPSADPLRSAAAWWHGLLAPGATPPVPTQWLDTGADAAAARKIVGGPVAVEALRSGESGAVAEAWRYVRLRPWWCEMPVPRGVKADAAEAMRLLRFHAAAGGPLAWYAQSAILGAARGADDSVAMRAVATPGGTVLRVAVSTDPHFLTTPGAPWNRSMLEWAYATQFHDSPGMAAVLFDGLDGLGGLDHNRATLAAADRAAAHAAGSRLPGVPRALDAFEFLDAFRRAIGPGRRAIALADPFEEHAMFAPFADVTVFTDAARPADGGARAFRHRLLAGARPCVRVISGDFEWMDPATFRAALADSLFLGMIPSAGRDAAGRDYWSQPAWVARDAVALRTLVPLARRLAAAGWRVEGTASAAGEGIDVESFGSGELRMATVRNGGRASREVELAWSEVGGPVYVVQPLTAACDYLEPREGAIRSSLHLGPGEVAVLDLVPAPAVEAELGFLDGWNPSAGEGEAAAANLRALRREMEAGVGTWVSCAAPLIRGSRNAVAVRILNRGDSPLVIAEARLTGAGGAAAMLAEPRILGAGEAAGFTGELTDDLPGATPWVTLSWRLQRGDREWISTRRLRAAFVAPVEVMPARAELAPAGTVAEVEVGLRNHSRQRQTVHLAWDGDFRGDRLETVLEPEESKTMTLPVAGEPGRSGRIEVRASAGGREIHRSDVRIRFPEAP